MTDAVMIACITTLGSTVSSGMGALAIYFIRQTHNLVNSKMTELLASKDEIKEVSVKAAYAEGIKEEKSNPS